VLGPWSSSAWSSQPPPRGQVPLQTNGVVSRRTVSEPCIARTRPPPAPRFLLVRIHRAPRSADLCANGSMQYYAIPSTPSSPTFVLDCTASCLAHCGGCTRRLPETWVKLDICMRTRWGPTTEHVARRRPSRLSYSPQSIAPYVRSANILCAHCHRAGARQDSERQHLSANIPGGVSRPVPMAHHIRFG